MKKLLLGFALLLTLVASNSIETKAIGVVIKIGRGIATWGDCRPGNGICFIVILTRSNAGLSTSEIASDIEMIDGTAELKEGKLYITPSKPISEKARNERGTYEIAIKEQGVKSSVVIDPAVAKELGVESLVVAPGNYEFKGNTLALKIISPRDISTGQASGKRVLPTVNKKDIAIDEPGVQKTTPTKGTGSSDLKSTYDLKENKK